MIPGEIIVAQEAILINQGRESFTIHVSNTGDRPIQVGSHYHFFEVNRFLDYERDLAYGCRLNIPAGTAVRFEPGQTRSVELLPYQGLRQVYGFRNLVQGKLLEKKDVD
jgi:urease subunit beta